MNQRQAVFAADWRRFGRASAAMSFVGRVSSKCPIGASTHRAGPVTEHSTMRRGTAVAGPIPEGTVHRPCRSATSQGATSCGEPTRGPNPPTSVWRPAEPQTAGAPSSPRSPPTIPAANNSGSSATTKGDQEGLTGFLHHCVFRQVDQAVNRLRHEGGPPEGVSPPHDGRVDRPRLISRA